MIVINIATFIRNRGKIREQLAGVAFYNSFSNNNEIWEGYFIQSSYLTQSNIFNAISLLPKACQKTLKVHDDILRKEKRPKSLLHNLK